MYLINSYYLVIIFGKTLVSMMKKKVYLLLQRNLSQRSEIISIVLYYLFCISNDFQLRVKLTEQQAYTTWATLVS